MNDAIPSALRASQITVDALFRRQTRYNRGAAALRHGERRMTYGELGDRVARAARMLSARGVKRGDRVAVLSENCLAYVELQLAAAQLGAMIAALNWRFAAPELRHCVNLVQPAVALVSERFHELWNEAGCGEIDIIDLSHQYDRLLNTAGGPDLPDDVAQPEDGLLILYTSGTTGLPKGAVISHRAAIARSDTLAIDQGLQLHNTFIAWAPLFHMASTDMTLATLMNGGTVIVVDGYQPDWLAQCITREKINWLLLLPGTVQRFIEEVQRQDKPVQHVQVIGAMADLVPPGELREVTRLTGAPYLNTFGSTETGMPPASRGMIAVGAERPILSKLQNSHCDVRLLDEDDHDVPDGEPGELAFRGPTLFSGYWGAPDITARDFRNGWFHMGDVFRRNPDGTLDFVDRRKYLIKSGGENIYPAEVERILLTHEAVHDAVVVRKHDPKWGEIPVAFLVLRDQQVDPKAILAVCEGRIARYKVPREVHIVKDSDLPRSATGKIQRYELESRFHLMDDTSA